MPGTRRAPAQLSDDWIAEQQMRAEMEAEAWRRLRAEIARPALPEPTPAPRPEPARTYAPRRPNLHRSGSLTLKALVRFLMAAAGAYLAYIAAADAQLGEFEIWLAIGAAFVTTLALTAFSPLRGAVYFVAETARWALILGLGLGALWWLMQGPPL